MSVIQRQTIIKFLASGFYSGYSPAVPGTVGSLIGVLAYLLLQNLSSIRYLTVVSFIFIAGVYISNEAEKIYGKKDSPHIVIDEVSGMLLTYLALPQWWGFLLAGFVFFRIFDILKPFPIRLIDRRLGGGWGIMLDDILAGVYANILIRILYRLIW
ncbi:MAG: hypothetical protein A2Z60_01170 [Nitrospirae bacterium RIFCSPLOWO2_02_42_7]|nr:MAG: hypothetical protein A2Z60_01170 [Nitrospirae bacterium RIFCSPLOWO2_02_42_7]